MKFGERVRLATPLPATWMSNITIHNVYIKFYTDVIGLEPKDLGWLYLAFNIWNVLNDPVIGVWLDRKRAVPHYYLYAPSTKERVQVKVVRQWIGNGVSFIATVVATQLLVGDLVTERSGSCTASW